MFLIYKAFPWPTQKARSRKGIHIIKAVEVMKAMEAMKEFITGKKTMFQLPLVISSIRLPS